MADKSQSKMDIAGKIGKGKDFLSRDDSKGVINKLGNSPLSLAGRSKDNMFEFPMFVSSSCPIDYTTATAQLLEQVYGSFLQMALSSAPFITAADAAVGAQFAAFKTSTNNYLECATTEYMKDVCHNVIENEDYVIEFNMYDVSDADAKIIQEAVDYQPLSEFAHYFTEAKDDKFNRRDTTSERTTSTDGKTSNKTVTKTSTPSSVEQQKLNAETNKATKDSKLADALYDDEGINREKQKRDDDAMTTSYKKRSAAVAADQDEELSEIKKQEQIAKTNKATKDSKLADALYDDEGINREKQKRDDEAITASHKRRSAAVAAYEDEALTDMRQQEQIAKTQSAVTDSEIKLATADDVIEKYHADLMEKNWKNSAVYRTMELSKGKTDAPRLMDEEKIQKINSLKPLIFSVTLKVQDPKGFAVPIEYMVGVKMFARRVDADMLPEIASYPLKEMNAFMRDAKWRAGELKFFKDIIFRISQKKQTAIDSKDKNRRWYRRLYELAHTTGDSTSVTKMTTDHALNPLRFIKNIITGKKDKPTYGFIPDTSIVITKADVDNINRETGIDLLDDKQAFRFCKQLFLMSFVVIDIDGESIKMMTPDLHKTFEVHSIASVNKQLAMLDTSGVKTDALLKALK